MLYEVITSSADKKSARNPASLHPETVIGHLKKPKMKQKISFAICLMIIFWGCNSPEKEIPASLIGNYFDKSGEEFWTYSFQKNFVIFDSQFWNVTKVVNRKDFTKISIENENSKKRLLISSIGNNEFKIDNDESSKIYSIIANPDLRKAKESSFALHPGKVKIRNNFV